MYTFNSLNLTLWPHIINFSNAQSMVVVDILFIIVKWTYYL